MTSEEKLKLAVLHQKNGNFNDAIKLYEELIAEFPTAFQIIDHLGMCYANLNHLIKAQELFLKAISLNPDYINPRHNLSYILLTLKDYTNGFNLYRYRYHHDIIGNSAGGVAYPPTLVNPKTDIHDKVLYISHEQGLGDTIQFIRFLPFFLEKCKKILCFVPDSLHKLLSINYPNIEFVLPNTDIYFDCNFPMLESPYLLNLQYDKIPFSDRYLSINNDDNLKFHDLINNNKKIKIGFNFKGSQGANAVKNRSIELHILLNYLNKLDKKFEIYSLQYDTTEAEDDLLNQHKIPNLGKHINDFYDTALLIEKMDYIISVDTSFLHLSGALGKQTFALLKFHPDWRWGESHETKTNWYNTITCIKQNQLNNWRNVCETLLTEIKTLKKPVNTE